MKHTLRLILILLVWGLVSCSLLMADDCFELYNYYSSRPTNYTTRGGDGWMATSAAVEPTSSMYFYSEYEYVMLTGGNKNTAPGQLQVEIQPKEGVDVLTFLIAKPCISDRYSGAGVYVYVDGVLVYSQLVVAYGLSYQQITIPINSDCHSIQIYVTNYYTNTTKDHNNRIAIAHFCWTDYKGSPTPPPVVKKDTVHYSGYICYEDVPYLWNGIQCIKTDDYYYTTKNTKNEDSTTVLHLTVMPQPVSRTDHEELHVGDRMLWHNQMIAPTEAGDFTYTDTVRNSSGCISYVYTLNLHVLPNQHEEHDCQPMITLRRDTAICEGESFEWFGRQISLAGKYSYKISSAFSATCDSVCYVLNVGYKQSYVAEETMRVTKDQLPIHWNGQDCSAAGDYVFHGATTEGCDSTITLHLQIIEQKDSICPEATHVAIDTTICPGQFLEWREFVTDVPGIYCDTIRSLVPPFCDSICFRLSLTFGAQGERYDTVRLCPSELPYHWYNQSLTKTGEYHYAKPSDKGCDSLMTLWLEVYPIDMTHEHRFVCPQQMPYLWNGISCATAGEYTAVLTNRYGCDSVVMLDLDVDTYSSADTLAFCCKADLPYLWHGHSLMESGTATWTTTNHVGCDSVVTLHLSVASDPLSIRIDTAVCSGTEILWHGNKYTSTGVYLDTLRTVAHCDSVYGELHLTYKQPTDSVTEATICKGETFEWHGRSYNTTTTIHETLTNSAGCDSVCTLRLLVRPYPQGRERHTICFGDSVFVHERWLKQAGEYVDTLRGASVDGCDSICRISIRVTPRPDIHRQAVRLYAEEMPYEWRGHTISGDIVLTDTITNASTGCDSIYYVLDLRILEACEPKPMMKKNK